jgi:hypothetical protein
MSEDTQAFDTKQDKSNGDLVDEMNAPIPMKSNGEDYDYAKVSPQRTHKFIYQDNGYKRDIADTIVQSNIDVAQNELDAVQNRQPKPGANVLKYNREMDEWRLKINAAQAKVDYWNQVKAIQTKLQERSSFNKMAMLAKAIKETKLSMDDEDNQIMETLKHGKTIWERPTK